MDTLTPAQLERLRALLQEREAEAARGLAVSSEDARPVEPDDALGRLTRMDALQQQQMAAARRRRVGVQLQQLRAARARLQAGTYGACVSCEEPIGFARLQARPESPLCRTCQGGAPER